MTKIFNLKPKQAKILENLEEIIECSIPHVERVKYDTLGVKVEGNTIVDLGLNNQGIFALPESIGDLISLKSLWLNKNDLTSLPESIGNLKSLKKLLLFDNQLTTIPDSISKLKSLKFLSLQKNKLTIIPDSISKLRSLTSLGLGGNKLTAIPDSISNLKLLTDLSLDGNKFTTLPNSILNLKLLKDLSLPHNQLKTLPESIGNLKSLERLNLANNQLIMLPESIGNLSSLIELNIYENQLRALPESIGNLRSLEILELYENELTMLPESFSQLKNLERIDLSKNNWKGDWKDMATNDIPTILKLSQKLNGIRIFISHAMKDEEQYRVTDLNNNLEKWEIVHKIYICEESTGAIKAFMAENIPNSHLLLFIGTKNSLNSKDCRYELALAKKYGVGILPLKGFDIKWKDLKKIDLRMHNLGFIDLGKSEGYEFSVNNFDDIYNKINEYIKEHETELKRISKERREIDKESSTIEKIILDFIKSEEYREHLKENFKEFKSLFEDLSNNQITSFEYALKWAQIFEKKFQEKKIN